MKAFDLNLVTIVLRLYFMMLIVIVAGFVHIWSLAFLALPVFLSCLLGVSFRRSELGVQLKISARLIESGIRRLHLPDHQTA